MDKLSSTRMRYLHTIFDIFKWHVIMVRALYARRWQDGKYTQRSLRTKRQWEERKKNVYLISNARETKKLVGSILVMYDERARNAPSCFAWALSPSRLRLYLKYLRSKRASASINRTENWIRNWEKDCSAGIAYGAEDSPEESSVCS